MIKYNENRLLNKSALNHAKYLFYHKDNRHKQIVYKKYFSGKTATKRANVVGFNSNVSENIAIGSSNTQESIDNLFTAIYHRFNFLNFKNDEMGVGFVYDEVNKSYSNVFNMGNSHLEYLCKQKSFEGYGTFYTQVCKDENFKIEQSIYLKAKNKNINTNPKIVVWPYANQKDFQPVFYEEIPDPLPNCSVSGNPISVQFNPLKSGDIKLKSFKLFELKNNNYYEVKDTKMMTSKNDPNKKFTNKQFALFPMNRLKWNQKYKIEFKYFEDNILKSKVWSFKTKALAYEEIKFDENQKEYFIKKDKNQIISFPTKNCNDKLDRFKYFYSKDLEVNRLDFIDSNTILLNFSGQSSSIFKFIKSNKEFHIKLID